MLCFAAIHWESDTVYLLLCKNMKFNVNNKERRRDDMYVSIISDQTADL